ncbi:MAG: peptidoglycan editing factor PgeF [Anaerolineales bacterium]|nr:peptidoglycan editing factor PgeF [Anaerolineales bacterium]
MQRIEQDQNAPIYYQFDQWLQTPLQHGIFTRHGGVSHGPWDSLNVGGTVGDEVTAVLENGRRILATFGFNEKQSCTVWQVHGVDTVVANGPMPQRKWLTRADGMITNKVGMALTMRFADCTPIMLYDPEHHAVGIVHAGWRGTVDGAITSAVQAMKLAYDTRPDLLQAAIGPSIGPDRYQVGEEVVAAVQNRFGTTDGLIKRADDGSAYFNLWEANRRLLAASGVAQIEVAGICTATYTDEFYSHRAEKGKTGRFGAVIALC